MVKSLIMVSVKCIRPSAGIDGVARGILGAIGAVATGAFAAAGATATAGVLMAGVGVAAAGGARAGVATN